VADRPELRLPPRPPEPRPIFDRRSGFFAACVLGMFGVLVYLLLRSGGAAPPASPTPAAALSAEECRELAQRLEDRNLPRAAAAAWRDYLACARLDRAQAGAVQYRIGRLLKQAGRYEQAIASFYTAERLVDPQQAELHRQIALEIRECFQKLGQYGDLARELAARSAVRPAQAALAGQQVVAQIGQRKMTVADFDRRVQDQIDAIVQNVPGLSPEQADELRKQLMSRYASPQAKARTLRDIVVREILAEEARKQGLHESQPFKERLMQLADDLLANHLLAEQLRNTLVITDEDLERYYALRKDRYKVPAQLVLARIVCPDLASAKDVIRRLNQGAEFDALAEQVSRDRGSQPGGGVLLEPPLVEGRTEIPGLGDRPELVEALWKLAPGQVLAEPVRAQDGFWVLKVHQRRPARQPSLQEVRDQVRRDFARDRTEEITRHYVQQLFEKYRVKLYPQAFAVPASRPAGNER